MLKELVTFFLLAVSLAMDCFAVSCATGVRQPRLRTWNVLFFAFCFGFFQTLMPLLGWLLGEAVVGRLEHFTGWVAFGILAFVGVKMIWEGLHDEAHDTRTDITRPGTVLLLSVATSLDALAVGFSFSMVQTARLWMALLLIGLVSFGASAGGYYLTRRLRRHVKAHIAEIMGGVILVLLGLKILLGL